MTLADKIKKAETCIFHCQGRCSLNGYPPFDCGVCKSFKEKEAERNGGQKDGPADI